MNEVIDFLKSNKFQTECDVTETWQVVDIDFCLLYTSDAADE